MHYREKQQLLAVVIPHSVAYAPNEGMSMILLILSIFMAYLKRKNIKFGYRFHPHDGYSSQQQRLYTCCIA
jgi:hypothetical protein